MDAIISKSEPTSTFTGDLILYFHDHTAPKSPWRKLLGDWWVSWSNSTWLEEEYCGNYSKRSLFDVALAESKLELRGSKKIDDGWAASTNDYV